MLAVKSNDNKTVIIGTKTVTVLEVREAIKQLKFESNWHRIEFIKTLAKRHDVKSVELDTRATELENLLAEVI